MPRYMIEVRHGEGHEACVSALRAIENFGSHLMTHAEWGCKDGHHACWLIGDLESRDDAMRIVPPEFRSDTRVVKLNRFTREELAALATKPDQS